jgi:isopentenyl diphosphate isomerase/L-lactate dehydrogenase-like FMN-dependent dehydrogenase
MKAVERKHVTTATPLETLTGEPRKGRKTAADREADRAERERREAEAKAARRAEMPALLFGLMVQCKELENKGMDVMCDVYASLPESYAYMRSEAGLPGVVFTFGRQRAADMEDWRDANLERDVLSVESEQWQVDAVVERFSRLQQEADEKKRQRALAEEAKKLLTPEQLAALKQYG